MKVDYLPLSGGVSTAYLEEETGNVRHGTDKHTDEELRVRWDNVSNQWVEVSRE